MQGKWTLLNGNHHRLGEAWAEKSRIYYCNYLIWSWASSAGLAEQHDGQEPIAILLLNTAKQPSPLLCAKNRHQGPGQLKIHFLQCNLPVLHRLKARRAGASGTLGSAPAWSQMGRGRRERKKHRQRPGACRPSATWEHTAGHRVGQRCHGAAEHT